MTHLPADVIELVIAARIVAYEDQSPEAIAALDKAVEAFADRVGWDDEPADDGAIYCFACNQIDEPEHHNPKLCPASAEYQLGGSK